MAKNIQDAKDIRSTSDAIAYARNKGAKVEHVNGKLYKIETEKGSIHLRDDYRAMPRQERDLVKFWIFCLGIIPLLLIAVIKIF